MTTKINGTNTAANPAITGADTDTGLSFASDTVNINTGGATRATIDSAGALDVPTTFPIKVNGSEKLRITSSGNVGIGKTPSDRLDVQTTHSSGGRIATFYNSDSGNNGGLIIKGGGSDGEARLQSAGGSSFLTFYTEGGDLAERSRIDSAGCLQINQTSKQYSDLKLAVSGSNSNVAYFDATGNGNNYAVTIKHGYASSGQNGVGLRFLNSSGTEVGKIDFGQSSTQYRTSSDYRLKENAVTISDGITRLKTLKPYRFNWISEPDQPKVDGFLAHEVTAVPEAIGGTKDEVDSDSKPVYQGIDQSKLVPLLTAALQEAIAKIETLEIKVAALEAG